MPLVSVLLPVYNAIHDLPRALHSLRAQRFDDFEVVAIDDGSTDGSGEMLDEAAHTDPRIRVFHQANAGALGSVLNRAAELARGKYLARQDADDASHPARLENQVRYLEARPETGLCGTWAWFIDASLGPLFSLEVPDEHARLSNYLLKGLNPFVHGSVMLRAGIFKKTGGYRGSYSEDFDLWLRLSNLTRLGMCQQLGYYYWRSVGGINSGAHQRQRQLNQFSIQLHHERTRIGHEISDWQAEYGRIVSQNTAENSTQERETSMLYARSLMLMRFQRYAEARSVLQKAAAGQSYYAQKARRNLRLAPFFPLLSLAYRLMELREPFRYARALPAGSALPDFTGSNFPDSAV